MISFLRDIFLFLYPVLSIYFRVIHIAILIAPLSKLADTAASILLTLRLARCMKSVILCHPKEMH